jgi:hypothetical protein
MGALLAAIRRRALTALIPAAPAALVGMERRAAHGAGWYAGGAEPGSAAAAASIGARCRNDIRESAAGAR